MRPTSSPFEHMRADRIFYPFLALLSFASGSLGALPPGGGGLIEQVKVVIHTDGNAGEPDTAPGGGDGVSWTINDALGFPVADSDPYAGLNDELIEQTVDLPTTYGNCYSFFLHDNAGDGLCCTYGNGYWELRTVNGGLILRDQFASLPDGEDSPSTSPTNPNYTYGHEFCLPVGPSNIVANECNVFTNDLLNKVYTTAVPGVLNYEFEMSDPDAGARRRIQVPRRWVRFGDMGDYSALVPGATYFCRVRADQGAVGFIDDHFGTGCEMGIDATLLVQCSQLVDRPGLRNHSCGASKHFGGSDKVWAVPVLYADEYRFNFHKIDGTVNRNMQLDYYVCVLDWVTEPLTPGNYTVTVEVRIGAQWSGICGDPCPLTILEGTHSPEFTGDLPDGMATLSLYPNPASGRQLTVRLEHLGQIARYVTVEVFDTFGKRVMTSSLPVQDGMLNTVLDLPTDMAAGLYMVHVTAADPTGKAGDVTKTERLMIQR